MVYDLAMTAAFYKDYAARVERAREAFGRPLTYTEKALFAHAAAPLPPGGYRRGEDYALFSPDRVAMQDATAQMAILQFMNAGREATAVPATVHCDHLVQAYRGAGADLDAARQTNREVYDFLRTAARRYGMGFWGPGAGIIHQTVMENYAFPGGMMVGTDSHTPNAGGMGMAAIGAGGADAVDVMTGTPWELKVPRIIGVELTGRLTGWTSAKDVILHLAGLLTAKGATNAVIEYFGEGAATIPATGKATICNMGAETGATTSIFPYDAQTEAYLMATGREEVARMARRVSRHLRADDEVTAHPERFYDQVVTIDLSALKPHLNGPFTPDAACPVDRMAEKVRKENLPERVEVCLIGSCTNSSYADLARAASVLKACRRAGHELKAQLIVCPGSELVRQTAERDGLMEAFEEAGAVVMANACGPCIGQWRRVTDDPTRRNSIVTTFNRNFAKRADGNPNTCAFVASPETAVGYALTGRLTEHPSFSPGWETFLPQGDALPAEGFAAEAETVGAIAPPYGLKPDASVEVVIEQGSERLQRLKPFDPWDGKDFEALPLLIKTKGKCTTDHISPAGAWLRYRGHLERISRNLLLGATNAFTGKTGTVTDRTTGKETEVWQTAAHYRGTMGGSVIVAEDNYGEGSSREHAAMEPRFLGVKAVIAKSFARIHETNLKKQGVLALTFARASDYDRVREDDRITIRCAALAPDRALTVTLHHADGTIENLLANHTYNEVQTGWFRAGGAVRSGAKIRQE